MFKFLTRQKKSREALIEELFGGCEMPSFSSTVMDVLSVLRNPAATVKDLIQKIELDPGLSVKVLRTVNSAAFGLTSEVKHVGHAVSLLGRSRLESIVVPVAVKASLPSERIDGFDHSMYWQTAARRACLARLVANHLHPDSEIESFTAGLLLDMGVLLLLKRKREEYVGVYREWQNDPAVSLHALENETYGYDHTDVGAVVADAWKLPGYMVQAIKRHHDEGGKDAVDPAVRLVSYLRDGVLTDGRGTLVDLGSTHFDIEIELLEHLVDQAFDHARQYQEILSA